MYPKRGEFRSYDLLPVDFESKTTIRCLVLSNDEEAYYGRGETVFVERGALGIKSKADFYAAKATELRRMLRDAEFQAYAAKKPTKEMVKEILETIDV